MVSRIMASLWCVGYLFMIAGCGDFKGAFATPILSELNELASPMNEFFEYDTSVHKMIAHEGVYVGTKSVKGEEWRLYQFPKILNPATRVLEVLVGQNVEAKVMLREADSVSDGELPAFLFDHCFCGTCVPGMEHGKHFLYTNALGSTNFISSRPERLGGNFYSGGFADARIDLKWEQRSRKAYGAELAKLLYAVPFDFIILPVQPYFGAMYSL